MTPNHVRKFQTKRKFVQRAIISFLPWGLIWSNNVPRIETVKNTCYVKFHGPKPAQVLAATSFEH